jgi:hypothetical protein
MPYQLYFVIRSTAVFIFNKILYQQPLSANRIIMDIVYFLHQKRVRNNSVPAGFSQQALKNNNAASVKPRR